MKKSKVRSISREQHRKLGASLYNRTWSLMEKKKRSKEEDAEMIRAAHASRLHWGLAGGNPQNFAIGEWQISRVYSILRMPESAVYHAMRSLEIVKNERQPFDDFLLPSVYEGLARAYASIADMKTARRYYTLAARLAKAIKDPEDRKLIQGQIASVPIHRKRS